MKKPPPPPPPPPPLLPPLLPPDGSSVGVVPVPAARWQCAVARKEKHQSVLYLLKTFKLQLEKNFKKMQKKRRNN